MGDCRRKLTFLDCEVDAVIEEALRLHSVLVTREAICDTEILGYPIPKGTTVFMITNGAGYRAPSLPIDEAKRSATSKAAPQKHWDETKDLLIYDPERWLVENEKSQIVFDANAGPNISFGGGARGCWGRKIAYIQMRTMTTLMVWNFNLLQVPEVLRTRNAVDTILHEATDCFMRLEKRDEVARGG